MARDGGGEIQVARKFKDTLAGTCQSFSYGMRYPGS